MQGGPVSRAKGLVDTRTGATPVAAANFAYVSILEVHGL
jgi:hypothetical protein